jgi:hypothetical protein
MVCCGYVYACLIGEQVLCIYEYLSRTCPRFSFLINSAEASIHQFLACVVM